MAGSTKGGVYGSFVLIKMEGGTSKEFPMNKSGDDTKPGKYKKSPYVWVKRPVAQFFGFKEESAMQMLQGMTQTVKTKINGKEETVTKMVKQGATGASRAVKVRFTKPQNIGGKSVASVNIPMPSSCTFADMIRLIFTEGKNNKDAIAAIVSPSGASFTVKTPYNPKAKK